MDTSGPSEHHGDQGAAGDRLLALVSAVHRVSHASSLAEIQGIVGRLARELTGSDGATFAMRDGDLSFYVDEDAIAPLWKGQRFPLRTCISGLAMLQHESIAIPDIYADDRVPHDAYRPTFVKSLLMTPIRVMAPIGAIGVYWANYHVPSCEEIGIMRVLADSTAVAIESAAIWRNLGDRTAELADSNNLLGQEVIDLRQAEVEASELAITDELTGLYNRRGLVLLAGKALDVAPRAGGSAHFVVVDVDGLKAVNDAIGHAQGSAMIVAAAMVLRRSFRSTDIIARTGGDEFAVYVPGADHPDAIAARIELQTQLANLYDLLPTRLSLSVGVAQSIHARGTSLDEMLRVADAEMYLNKQAKSSGGSRRAP